MPEAVIPASDVARDLLIKTLRRVARMRRMARTLPMLADLPAILDDAPRRLSPKSEMAKAIVYGRKRWTALDGSR